MIIDVYCLCYNEIKLAPFAVQYWKRYAHKVYIYDNGSTDGCIEYFNQFPDLIEVNHFESEGMNDKIHLLVKDNWKNSIGKADFVVVSDFDEFLYSPDLFAECMYMQENNMTICKCRGYDMVCDEFPNYEPNRLSHEVIKYGSPDLNMSKCILFNPNEIIDINYTPGCHTCAPTGNIKFYDGNKIFLFHHKFLGIKYYFNLINLRKSQLSLYNIQNQYGIHYLYSESQLLNEFNYKKYSAIDVTTLY